MPGFPFAASKPLAWQDLIEAGDAILNEQGLEGLSVEAIVERARTAKGTFYHYFESKEAFLRDLAQHVGDGAAFHVEQRGESLPTAGQRVEALAFYGLGYLLGHPGVLRACGSVLSRSQAFLDLVARWLREGEDRQELWPGDSVWYARFIAATIDAAARWFDAERSSPSSSRTGEAGSGGDGSSGDGSRNLGPSWLITFLRNALERGRHVQLEKAIPYVRELLGRPGASPAPRRVRHDMTRTAVYSD